MVPVHDINCVSPQSRIPPSHPEDRRQPAWLHIQLGAKTLLDSAGSAFLLLLAAPVLALAVLAVWLEDGRPIFYRRRVLGQHGPFDAFKIRTMRIGAEEMLGSNPELEREFKKNFKLANDPRITRCGRILRRYNLDESAPGGRKLADFVKPERFWREETYG